jgi:MSHA biogenesis protein MshI
LSELKLPEPKCILLTPSFYEAEDLLHFLQKELDRDVQLLDLKNHLEMDPPLSLKEQKDCFFSIGGALSLKEEDVMEESNP